MHLKSLTLLIVSLMLPTLVMGEVLSVSFSGTEMRSAPNAMASKVIGTAPTFTPLTVLEKGADYYKVKDYLGRTGWVHRALLGTTPGITITADRANVRQGPGTNHAVVLKLSKGDACQLLSKQEQWLEIQTAEGNKGWIAEFLTWGQ